MTSSGYLYVYFFSLTLSTALGLYRWRRLDIGLKFIVVLLANTLIVEVLTYKMSIAGFEVGLPHKVYSVIESGLITLFFLHSIQQLTKKLIVFVIAIWGVLVVFNALFVAKYLHITNGILTIQALTFTQMALVVLYRLMVQKSIELLQLPSFWIWSLVMMFYLTTFLYYGLFNEIQAEAPNIYDLVLHLHLLENLVFYFALGIVIFCSADRRSSYE